MRELSGRWRLPLTSVSVIASPLVVIAGILISLSNSAYVDPYWLDLSSKSTVSLLLLAPGFSALAAWDAARWRVLMPGSVRTWVGLLGRHLAIVAVLSGLTFFLTLVILYLRTPPVTGFPRVDVLAVGILATSAYASVGFAAGRFLPRLLAAPIAFLAVWLWVAYTPAVQPFWLRNITGNLGTSCCALDQQLVRTALLAPSLLAVTLIAAVGLVLTWTRRRLAWLGSILGIALGVAISGSLVSTVGADPVEQRRGTQQCETSGSMTLCAWPEHRSRLREAIPVIADAADRLRAARLDVPTRLHENSITAGWSYSLMSPDPEVWKEVFATSPLVRLPPDCTNHNGGDWPAGIYEPLARSWLLVKAGVSTPEEAIETSGGEVGPLRSLLVKSERGQVDWFASAASAMKTCEPLR